GNDAFRRPGRGLRAAPGGTLGLYPSPAGHPRAADDDRLQHPAAAPGEPPRDRLHALRLRRAGVRRAPHAGPGSRRAGLRDAGVARLDLLGSSALLSRDHRRVPRPDARPHDGQPALRGACYRPRRPLGMTGEVQCRRLPWDSDFFGVSIGIAEVGRISERDLTTIRDWCREQGLACLYLLADPADAAGLRLLDDFGFD